MERRVRGNLHARCGVGENLEIISKDYLSLFLNCKVSKSRCGGFVGIDDKKVKLLRQIVEFTGAILILSSSWKDTWERIEKENQDLSADYLDRKLKREKLRIFDKTKDKGENRGEGILKWVKAHNVKKFIILDDEDFDFAECGIKENHIKTKFYDDNGGLQDEHVEAAIKILNS